MRCFLLLRFTPRAARYTFGITEDTVQIAVEQGAGDAAVVDGIMTCMEGSHPSFFEYAQSAGGRRPGRGSRKGAALGVEMKLYNILGRFNVRISHFGMLGTAARHCSGALSPWIGVPSPEAGL